MNLSLAVAVLCGFTVCGCSKSPSMPKNFKGFSERYEKLVDDIKNNSGQTRPANYDDEARALYEKWRVLRDEMPNSPEVRDLIEKMDTALTFLVKDTARDRVKVPDAPQIRP